MAEHLRYVGDRTDYDPDLILGPDRDGRRLRIVGVTYDRVTDVSTATLKAVMPQEFRDRLMAKKPVYDAYNRIRALFNE